MAWDELLGTYLNDHLAGSAAGLELAEKLRDNNQGPELGDLMVALHPAGDRGPVAPDRGASWPCSWPQGGGGR
jgi:hypothetical protein